MQAVRLSGNPVVFEGETRLSRPQVELADFDLPVLGDCEVMLEPSSVGICGSDIHACRADANGLSRFSGPLSAPVTLGHEVCGRVIECGTKVTMVQLGWWVVAETILNCGQCDSCQRNMPNHCRSAKLLGLSVNGALADRVAIPARNCWRVDDRWPRLAESPGIVDVLTLVEPLSCIVNSIRESGIGPGSRVLIVGAGPLGFAAAQIAKRMCGVPPLVLERSAARCNLISTGADVCAINVEVSTSTIGSIVETIRTHALRGRVDIVIEVAGVPSECLTQLATLIDDGGSIVYLARAGRHIVLPADVMVTRRIRLQGSRGPNGPSMGIALSLLEASFPHFAGFVSKKIRLAEAPHWLMQSDYLNEGKVVVRVR